MKYVILLLMTLSFAAGVLGFTLLPGVGAIVSRIGFMLLLVAICALFAFPKRERVPRELRRSFAEAFTTELPSEKNNYEA